MHTEYQVNHKTQPFWVNVQTLAGHDVDPKRFRDLLGTLYAPVSKIPFVNTYSSVVESDNEMGKISYLDMECPRRTRPRCPSTH